MACPFGLSQTQFKKDLEILFDSSLSPTAQIGGVLTKSRCLLSSIKRTFQGITPKILISLYCAIGSPHLEYFQQIYCKLYLRHNQARKSVRSHHKLHTQHNLSQLFCVSLTVKTLLTLEIETLW